MPLSPDQLFVADRLVELRILKADGSAYEDLFTEVMTLRYADFRPVKPQGNIGDRKNDGYREKAGIYYQVYAPEAPAHSQSVSNAVRKIKEDFEELKKFWDTLCPITGFNFVFNDKFKGANPTIEATLLQLKNDNKLADCRCSLAKDLTNEISQLSERHLLKITGILPSPETLGNLDFGIFTEVLRYVTENSSPLTREALLTVPNFLDKIRLNGISETVAALLTTANLQSGAVEKFFAGHGAFSKPVIRDKLAQIYSGVRDALVGDGGANSGDLIFFSLLNSVTPHPATKHSQDAAMVLLAYFFESCDIYEDPAAQTALNI
jgi:hypothetical protein